MKNFSDIQTLLDRYWEGETTLEEERALKAYFASGQVDERLRAVAPFFQALREEQTVQYAKAQAPPLRPVLFTWQKLAAAASVVLLLTAGLWWWARPETPALPQIAEQTAPPAQPLAKEEIAAQQPVFEENKVAADNKIQPFVLAKKTFAKRAKKTNAEPIDPETEKAIEEIKAALALVSSKMKKGKREAAKGAVHLENVDIILKKKSEG